MTVETAAHPVIRVHDETWDIVDGELVRGITDAEVVAVLLGPGRPYEVDEHGRRVDPADTLKRGRIVVGLRLLEQEREANADGHPGPDLCPEGLRCVEAAKAAGLTV